MSQPSGDQPPEIEALARRFLTLWEEQWSALAADPEMAEAAGRMNAMVGQAMSAFSAPLAAAAAANGDDRAGPNVASGAASAAAPPDVVADALARLEGRLAGIERQLAELAERLGDGGTGKPGGGTRRGGRRPPT